MYKKSSDFIVPLLCRERKTFFLIPYFYCPLLDPRYLRFTVQIPVFRGGFFPKKKAKNTSVFVRGFCKIIATSTATKKYLSLKIIKKNPQL